jgi:hypothetical protein
MLALVIFKVRTFCDLGGIVVLVSTLFLSSLSEPIVIVM